MKTIDHCIKKTAIELGVEEEEVKKVVMAYWEDIYYRLIKANNTAITVRHLGTFAISRFKLNRFIKKKIKLIKKMPTLETKTEKIKEDWMAKEREKLTLALKHRNEIAIQYAEIFGNV